MFSTSRGRTPFFQWMWLAIPSVVLASLHPILINLGKNENNVIPFSSVSVALLIELLKLFFSIVFMLGDKRRSQSIGFPPKKMLMLYSAPAVLYTLNNNLITHALLYMDPATFQVLNNLKIAASAVFYKLIINRHMTKRKWLAVALLFVAGIVNSLGGQHGERSNSTYVTVYGILLVCVYSCVSALAGVYTEAVLKKYEASLIHTQNSILYVYGVLLNGMVFLWRNESFESFFVGFSLWTWCIVVSQAIQGIIVSYILKHLSSLFRLFTIATSTILTTLLSMGIFGVVVNLNFVVSLIIIIYALYVYFV